jgi:ribokinase
MTVVVFGSINMDLVARTPRLPGPAETILGHEFFTAPGGKGANQAVAVAKLGIPTKIVGRVGADGFGQELQQHLANIGVDTSAILVDETISSGVALIAVDDTAQNSIIVIPGANGQVAESDVQRLEAHLAQAKVLLLQFEIPLEATLAAARVGQQQNLTIILDPAPVCDIPAELYKLVDIITPNEVEASHLVGFPVKTEAEAQRAAQVLLEKGVKTAIIKLGALGAFYATADEQTFVPAYQVKAIDTVAAGDAFNGGLASALVEGRDLASAVRWAAAVGALSTTKAGAQPSMPSRAEVEAFMEKQNKEDIAS